MILTITLTPALDKTVTLPTFSINSVNRVTSLRLDPGGKGINVSKVLKELGGVSLALGILGGGTGLYIKNALSEMGIAGDFSESPCDTRTNLKIIDPVLHTNTDINEPGAPVDSAILSQVHRTLMKHVAKNDIVVFAGKLPPGAPDFLYEVWGRDCASRGARVFLDADGPALMHGLKAKPFLIKPNLEELERLTGEALESRESILKCCRRLIRTGIPHIVVSMGKDGAYFVGQQAIYYGHGIPVSVGSTVGAGDSMMAAVACGFAVDLPFEKTARLAIAASAANVMCSGTQPAPYAQIEALEKQVILEQL